MGAIKERFYEDEKQHQETGASACEAPRKCLIVKWVKKIYREINWQINLMNEESRRLRDAKEEVFRKYHRDLNIR